MSISSRISSGSSYVICTAGTRPTGSALYEGISIYETDTNRTLVYDGTGWVILSEPTQAWTPTFTGYTTGTPTTTGTTHRSDGWCDFQAKLTFGSTPGSVGALALTLPYTAAGVQEGAFMVWFRDIGVDMYQGTNEAGTTSVALYVLNAASTYVNVDGVTASTPFTFSSTDTLLVSGRYQMASRY